MFQKIKIFFCFFFLFNLNKFLNQMREEKKRSPKNSKFQKNKFSMTFLMRKCPSIRHCCVRLMAQWMFYGSPEYDVKGIHLNISLRFLNNKYNKKQKTKLKECERERERESKVFWKLFKNPRYNMVIHEVIGAPYWLTPVNICLICQFKFDCHCLTYKHCTQSFHFTQWICFLIFFFISSWLVF